MLSNLGARFRQNKKVFWVTGLKILARVGTHNVFFFWKNIILCILKGEMQPGKMHKLYFFQKT